MPITLEQAKNLSQNKLTHDVIDEFRQSPLLDALPFDNTVKPQSGKSLTYSFNRVTTLPTAGARLINGEYTAQETETTPVHVDLKVMGGSYEIDRVIAEDETQVVNAVEFQSKQKAKATRAEFHNQCINGDSTKKTGEFDGLDKIVGGTTTDISAKGIDLTSADSIKANASAFLYMMRQLRKGMDGKPTHYLMNSDMYAVFQSVADVTPNVRYQKNELGKEILVYDEGVLVDMGDKPGTSKPIIATTEPTADTFGETALYAVRVGMDGVHGVSPEGDKIVKTYLPNFSTPGAVKKGEVEFVGAIAVKSTRSVAKLSNIGVLPKTEETEA